MNELVLSQDDYFLFTNVFALLALAAYALLERRDRPGVLPWTWLAVFALGLALRDATRLLDLSFDLGRIGALAQTGLLAAALAALAEFGRVSWASRTDRAPGRWLHAPALALCLAIGWRDAPVFEATLRALYGAAAGAAAGSALAAAARSKTPGGRWLGGAAAAVALLVLLLMLEGPDDAAGRFAGFNRVDWIRRLGAPLEFFSRWVALAAAVFLAVHHRDARNVENARYEVRAVYWSVAGPAVGLLLILAVGSVATAWVGRAAHRDLREEMAAGAREFAAAVRAEDVAEISRESAQRAVARQRAVERLRQMGARLLGRFRVALVGLDGERALLLAEVGQAASAPPFAPPAGACDHGLGRLAAEANREAAVTTLSTPADPCNRWTTVFAPIASPDAEQVIAFVGVIADSQLLRRAVARSRLSTIGLVFGVCLIAAAGFFANHRSRVLAEQALVAERKYHSLAEHSPNAVIRFDRAGRLRYVNPAATALCALQTEQWRERTLAEAGAPPELAAGVAALAQQAAASGATVAGRVEAGPASSRRIGDWRVIPEFWPDGTLSGVLATGRDVTEAVENEERLRRSRQNLLNLSANIPGVVYQVRVAPDGAIHFPFVSSSIGRYMSLGAADGGDLSARALRRLHQGDLERALRLAIEALAAGAPWEFDLRYQGRNGWRWAHTRATPRQEPDGTLVWNGVVTDIHERKTATDSLRRRDAVLAALSSSAEMLLRGGDWRPLTDHVLARVGAAAEISRVYVFENVTGPQGDLQCSQRHEWAAPGIAPQIGNPELQGTPYADPGPTRWMHAMQRHEPIVGHVRDFPANERALLEPQGILSLLAAPIYVDEEWWGFIGFDDCLEDRDWSEPEVEALKLAARTIGAAIERRRAEDHVRRVGALLQAVMNAIPTPICYKDRAGVYQGCNSAFEALLGLPKEQILGRTAENLPPPVTVTEQTEIDQRVMESPGIHTFEKSIVAADGAARHLIVQKATYPAPDGGMAGVVTAVFDITERKIAEQVLTDAHAELERRVQERTAALSEANRALRTQIGVRRRIEEELETTLAALRESEAQFRLLAENIRDLVLTIDANGVIRYVTPSAETILGHKPADLVGRPFLSFLHREDRRRVAEEHQALMQRGWANSEYRCRRADGRFVWIEAAAKRLNAANGSYVGAVVASRDITERRDAERQLMQAEKLAALGQIVAGVAHEINNPNSFIAMNLPVLRAYFEAMLRELDRGAAARADLRILNMPYAEFRADVDALLRDMDHGSRRITRIVGELKSYIRSGEEPRQQLHSLKDVVEQVMVLVGKQIQKSVRRVEVTIAEDLPPLRMNSERIEQVLVNMLINAASAADKTDSWIRVAVGWSAQHLGCVEILIEDNGVGIQPDNLPRIFNPFFTTRQAAGGTGLGLAISKKIVTEHGGDIFVESRPGQGARFAIVLPSPTDQAANADA